MATGKMITKLIWMKFLKGKNKDQRGDSSKNSLELEEATIFEYILSVLCLILKITEVFLGKCSRITSGLLPLQKLVLLRLCESSHTLYLKYYLYQSVQIFFQIF